MISDFIIGVRFPGATRNSEFKHFYIIMKKPQVEYNKQTDMYTEYSSEFNEDQFGEDLISYLEESDVLTERGVDKS